MKLIDYMPDYYKDILEVEKLISSEQTEINQLKDVLNDVRNQMFVDTATWGLSLWEKDLELENDADLDIEEKRAAIKSKCRSQGKADVYLLQSICDAWNKGLMVDFNNGAIEVKFSDNKELPLYIEQLKKQIEKVKPAHLVALYEYLLLVKNINNMTIKQLQQQNVNNFEFGEEII
ncbi:putative phage tail protein [Abyssisolibacter fermentans]|uniref:putative phage tail protein n=1 Tax=Abyssisolibacter fermentans TaxID=1766203 RepID=UPI0008351666|nr:putative phage tail protein [Abyssisolibacter fermentans]